AVGTLDASRTHRFSEELRARTRFDGRLNGVVGLYYENINNRWYETIPWLGSPALNPWPAVGQLGPSVGRLPVTGGYQLGNLVKQKAFFSEVYFDVMDQLKLTVGGRYFDYDKTITSLSNGIVAQTDGKTTAADSGTTFKANLTYSF